MTILIDGSKHSYQFEYTLGIQRRACRENESDVETIVTLHA